MTRTHRLLGSLAVAGLAALTPAAPGLAQPLGTVVVELRIQSTAVRRFPALNGATAKARIEEAVAKMAAGKFGFLGWGPSTLDAAGAAPRLVLELWSATAAAGETSGTQPVCSPPAVHVRLVPKPRATEEEPIGDVELTGVCSSRLKRMTEDDFVAEVVAAVEQILASPDDMSRLQSEMLSQVPLARQLEAKDERLYLPRAPLNALKESEIEVRFGDDSHQFLLAHPFSTEGERTLVKVQNFDCAGFSSGGVPLGPFGACWHPSLPSVLAACGEPFAYMKKYEPSTRAEASAAAGAGAECGAEATPGIQTSLSGDTP